MQCVLRQDPASSRPGPEPVRVIVTRPAISAGQTAARLLALGHLPIPLPLTEAVHHPDAAIAGLAIAHAAIAVTSAEALRVLQSIDDVLQPHLDTRLYAVGEASAQAARDAGFRDVVAGAGTGAELAELIAGDAADLGRPLLYLAGKPRSPAFEQGLAEHGVSILTVECYAMQAIPYVEPVEISADAVLLYSREAARLFFELSVMGAEAMRICCLSDNVATAVPARFRKNTHIAAQPDEEGIFALL